MLTVQHFKIEPFWFRALPQLPTIVGVLTTRDTAVVAVSMQHRLCVSWNPQASRSGGFFIDKEAGKKRVEGCAPGFPGDGHEFSTRQTRKNYFSCKYLLPLHARQEGVNGEVFG